MEHNFSDYTKKTRNIGAGLLGLLVLVAGLSYYLFNKSEDNMQNEIIKANQKQQHELQGVAERVAGLEKETTSLMSPEEIAAKYSKAVVLIQLDWRLTHRETNKQVYHRLWKSQFPMYLRMGDQVIPWLIIDDENGTNYPIGGSGQGSGFSVSQHGSILTNRHVAAGATFRWRQPYMAETSYIYDVVDAGDTRAPYYIVKETQPTEVKGQRLSMLLDGLSKWVPSKEVALTILKRRKRGNVFEVILRQDQFFSRDKLSVYFPNDPTPMPGRLARKSRKHDVALITVDPAGPLPQVRLEESTKEPALGERVTILGYPGVSPSVLSVTRNSNPFDTELSIDFIPNPTLTTGHMGKRITSNLELSDPDTTAITQADEYQLTATATGEGNSGGPVFNDQGLVTGIFYAIAFH